MALSSKRENRANSMINILYGLLTMALCLVLQALLIGAAIRYYMRQEAALQGPTFFQTTGLISAVMIMLVLGNLAQVGIWAILFQLLGEFHSYRAAFYHSAVNFATLGYGDIVMSEEHRLLGPLEAINGVLMIGVSTALLMATFQDAIKKAIESKHGDFQ